MCRCNWFCSVWFGCFHWVFKSKLFNQMKRRALLFMTVNKWKTMLFSSFGKIWPLQWPKINTKRPIIGRRKLSRSFIEVLVIHWYVFLSNTNMRESQCSAKLWKNYFRCYHRKRLFWVGTPEPSAACCRRWRSTPNPPDPRGTPGTSSQDSPAIQPRTRSKLGKTQSNSSKTRLTPIEQQKKEKSP